MNQTNSKILTINLSPRLSQYIAENFTGHKYTVTVRETFDFDKIAETLNDFQLVIISTAANSKKTDNLNDIIRAYPSPEFLIVDDTHTITDDRLFDLIDSTISEEKLIFKINKALKAQRQKAELILLKQQVAMNYGFDNLVGNSKALKTLKESLRNVSATDIAVLLSGPSGSGKALAARVMHYHSERRKNPLISLDCSSVPNSLADEIIFGKNENQTDFGLLQKADTGTLILKNVDQLPISTQHRLISFLLTNTVRKNDMMTSGKIDIRLISTSEKDLAALVAKNLFIEELSHQLGEVIITVPSLSKRIDDIEMLCEYFTRQISFETGRPAYSFSRGALELLFSHSWSGNIRELENTIKRATTLCRNNQIEETDILFIESGQSVQTVMSRTEERSDSSTGLLDEGQKTLIIKALKDNSWNFTQTAQELGIGRTTLWRKVKKYNLKKEEVETV